MLQQGDQPLQELELAKAYERDLATKSEMAPTPEARAAPPSVQIVLPEVEKECALLTFHHCAHFAFSRESRQKEHLKQQVWKEQFREEVKQAIDTALADAPPEVVRGAIASPHRSL